MKTYAHPEELQQAPPEIREHLAAIVGDEGDSLEYALGGPVCIVEDLGDLEQAVTTTPSWVNPGNWASVLESPGAVDSVQWIGDHLEFLLCTNNGGGTTFYVPRAIVDLCPNLERSMELTVAADLKLSHRADVAVSHLQSPNRQERRDISGGFAGSLESRRTPLKGLSSGSAPRA